MSNDIARIRVENYDKRLEDISKRAEANAKAILQPPKYSLSSQDAQNRFFNATVNKVIAATKRERLSAASLANKFLLKTEMINSEYPRLPSLKKDVAKLLNRYRCHIESGDYEAFYKEAISVAGDVINTTANSQMVSGNRAKLRFARVPIYDAKVCEYCITQASRGFVFASKAGAFRVSHQRCRCRVLPEGSALAVGYSEDLFRELYALDKYLKQVKELDRRAFMQQLIVLKHTDKDFANSVFASFSYEKGIADFSEKSYEALESHEQNTVNDLQMMGYSPRVLKEYNPKSNGVKNIDSIMNGVFVEWKDTMALQRSSIQTSLRDARRKWKKNEYDSPVRVVLTGYEMSHDSPLSMQKIYEEIKNRRDYYDELLFIGKNGEVKYFKGIYSQ